jgi:hypothetical protein
LRLGIYVEPHGSLNVHFTTNSGGKKSRTVHRRHEESFFKDAVYVFGGNEGFFEMQPGPYKGRRGKALICLENKNILIKRN